MKPLAAALVLAGFAARAEEIRIEVARGPDRSRVEAAARGFPGRVEILPEARGFVAVNVVDLEQYVAAVVASEVPAGWPREALRAQAVAARTFAVAQKAVQGAGARAHLGASVIDQVYRNAAHPPAAALEAARATSGEVLTWGAAPIAAYFSASCGGVSESAEAAFHLEAGSTPYIHGGEQDGDRREWTVRVPLAELGAALHRAGRMGAEVRDVAVASRTASGRAQGLTIATPRGARPLLAVELRQILGYTRLPSLLFDVAVEDKVAVFRGRGSGHGVGLCQWGARGRAERGESYREILAHYYPGAEIRRMY